MSHVLHRNLLKRPPRATRGDGVYVVDEDGRRYLDGCGGAAVSCLGHSHPAVIDAVRSQVAKLPYAHTSFFTTDVMEDLADLVVGNAPGMGKVLLLSGGSEAIEAALKLSRQYFVEAGEPKRQLYIARRQSYHGNTLGALSTGGNEWRRRFFGPIMMPGNHIAPCFEYRERADDETQEAFGLRVANELETKILELGPERVAAFVAETVVGATAGAVPPVPGYFRRVREICDQYGIHLILDEVMCGTGRTGTMMAYEQERIVPDIVTMAKGMGAGAASSSTATRSWATPPPSRPRWPRCEPSATTTCSPMSGGAGRSCRTPCATRSEATRTSATFAAADCSSASSSSPTARAGRRSTRPRSTTTRCRRPRWNVA
jgi:adenosylmethionine-8-amino-7-oxononanoate aminotransferase